MEIPKVDKKIINGNAKPIEIMTFAVTSLLFLVVVYDLYLNIKSNKMQIEHMKNQEKQK